MTGWAGTDGIRAAWQALWAVVEQALPRHWWALEGLRLRFAGQSASAAGPQPIAPAAPTAALIWPSATALLAAYPGKLVFAPSAGGGAWVPPPSGGGLPPATGGGVWV